MIRITVELVPFGTGDPVHLGTAIIANDGTGTHEFGNYDVRLGKKGHDLTASIWSHPWRSGKVIGFPRKQLLGWDLVYRALRDVVGERNP